MQLWSQTGILKEHDRTQEAKQGKERMEQGPQGGVLAATRVRQQAPGPRGPRGPQPGLRARSPAEGGAPLPLTWKEACLR